LSTTILRTALSSLAESKRALTLPLILNGKGPNLSPKTASAYINHSQGMAKRQRSYLCFETGYEAQRGHEAVSLFLTLAYRIGLISLYC
jgi:hypothetical protein